MEFMGIGMLEMIIILFLILVVFGPEKMIEIARTAGEYMRKFRMITSDLTRQITEEFDAETSELKEDIREIGSEVSGDLKSVSDGITKDIDFSEKADTDQKEQGQNE